MTDLPNKTFLRPDEVAPFLGVSRSTVYRWCEEGTIDAVKIRGTLRIPREAVERVISDSRV